ncbi:MAG: ATP-binding cassette domain-containing protein [Candidatus Marinimicrobia bacterium]|nr:ATP-binding cassette domain-containing protein [Candidatus Neomarinimicrobiota bacterium]MCF7851411.1 ATP-binding cassette domain-containing protein [Candidatus Neomarinimicrobiota bacterium]MCF7905322.1 ATP-binding cassette domain-containing protein [Candidatus Neomarinimicrobiota bacterium]
MIELINISKQYSSLKAVDDLSLVVQPGRICGFLGPNGAGKTTTIRMLMNIIHPDEGSIQFDGSPERPAAEQFGYLPEERGLYQKISVEETLRYFAHLRNVSDANDKILALLEQFDLHERLNSKVSELSKGNQQKLQFINTILHDPEYIILDEPFSGLDPVNQLVLKQILDEKKAAGKTIIFSSHQMDQVEKICDDVVMIHKGSSVLAGDLKTIKRRHGQTQLQVIPESPADLEHPIFSDLEADIRDDAAYLSLDGNKKQDLISRINQVLAVQSIKVDEPGLEEIFIQLVQGERT